MHKGTGKALCDECKFDQLHCKYCGSLKGKCKHPEICKKHQLFPKMIKYFGFDPEALGSEKIYDEYVKSVELIQDLYYVKKMSIPQIKEFVGYPSSAGALAIFLGKFVKFRTLSEASLNAIGTGRLKISSNV